MAFLEEAHVNDIGTLFRITVYDTTSTGGLVIADVSDASAITFTFRRPDGTTFNKTGSFTSDGTNGKVQYTTIDGDLNGAGTWGLQVLIVTSGGTSHNTTVGTFRVFENI
jgi:uncharacterized protein YfaS (alpha-2-macroglobulin family)